MTYEEFFEKAKSKQITNVQITEKDIISSSAEIINGELESFDSYHNIAYQIKAEYQGKTVEIATNYLADDIIDLIIEKATTTDTTYEDEYLENREPIKKHSLEECDISKEIQQLKELDQIREKYATVSKLNTYLDESTVNTRIINSNSVDISTTSHLCQFDVEVIVENKGDITSFSQRVLKVKKEEIDFKQIIKDTIEKAILQSTKEKIETKKYNIVLDSNVASRILGNMVGMLSATAVRKKISCLEKKKGQKIFNEKLTIIEDPTNEEYPGYRLFDDEGTLTKKKIVVENGTLKTFFYNVKEAKIKKRKSTGNGYQGIGTKNMYIIPGEKSIEQLLKEMKDGIYITDYMGASGSSMNAVNGNISFQVFGFLVKDGQLVSGIEPAIMTTTIFELWSNIEEIGNDLQFIMTSAASPSIQIKDISIAR